jgi:tetratricopeptide (TPR) repeat protein
MTAATTLLWLSILPFAADPLGRAIELYTRGRYEESAALLVPAAAGTARQGDARMWLGKTYLKLRRWDDAIAELERAVALDPRRGEYLRWLGHAYGAKAARVFKLRAFGLARKVRESFEAAVSASPEDLDAHFDLMQFYLEAPGIVGGGRDKANAQAAEIARLDPKSGCFARAQILESENRSEDARRELERAAAEFPNAPESRAELAAYFLRRSDYPAAEANAGKALQLRPGYPAALLTAAAARVSQGKDLQGTAATLRELASGPLGDNDPGFEQAYYWLGRALAALDQPSEARRAFETALRFDPEHAPSRDALARLRLK